MATVLTHKSELFCIKHSDHSSLSTALIFWDNNYPQDKPLTNSPLTHESGRGAESLYFGEVNKSVLTSYASVSEHRINQVPTFEVQRSSLT